MAADVANVEFLKGEIENIPLPDSSVNVIISNCVINLSVDKPRVLAEAFRFSIREDVLRCLTSWREVQWAPRCERASSCGLAV